MTAAANPFELLLDIEQKCKTYARPLPFQPEMGKTWQGIGFLCSDLHFVAPLAEIIEVLPMPSVTTLPSGAGWFKGIANVRGHVLPISDLQGFILENNTKPTSLSRVLVIDCEGSHVGFLVQQVLGIQRFMEKNLKPMIEEGMNEKFKPYLKGQFMDQNINWQVLSLKMLSETPQFYHMLKEAGGEVKV